MSSDEQQRGIVAGVAAYLVWSALTLVWVGLVIATGDAARRSRIRSTRVEPIPV